MCGIAGQVRLAGGPPPDPDAVRRMTAALAHRGPDDDGLRVVADAAGAMLCALGHRRLSVIDLACGHQPVGNEDGSVWTVFNGEICNFADLRRELEAAGHVFRTHTDTEVLVHGWEQWGTDLVDRLRGMFAFAIWDQAKRTLFAAVDPLGKKPLYHSCLGGTFRFGSELKALMADATLPREVDSDAVRLYLTVGYVPHPWTILRGVNKLSPGHWLTVTNGVVDVRRYWRPPPRPTFGGSFDDAVRQLRDLVTTAVRRRLVADVPVGAFLSGGVDSTVVVGLMSKLLDRPVQTFTIGFDEPRFDESAYAKLVAERFGTDHHSMVVRPDALAVLPTLASHFDEPFADSSAVPTYYVSKFTREHVTVALTGDGGDEAFGGYRRYRAGKVAGWLAKVPGGRGLLGVGRHLIPAGVDRTSNLGRTRRALEQLAASPADAYLAQVTQFDAGTLDGLLSPDFAGRSDAGLAARWFGGLYDGTDPVDPAAGSMTADLGSYLPGDILTKVDRASMAVSLECRSPLLDRDVVEFACGLPTSWRLRGFAGHKHVLKAAFADLIPPAVARRRKAGFGVPLAEWFRGPLRGLLRDTLLDGTALGRGYFAPAAVERMVAEHEAGRNHAASLWTLLMLEMWHRTWGG
jgi:asparagine synthase (glutamine-hydrolysing)